jgi:replicative DNA helicase
MPDNDPKFTSMAEAVLEFERQFDNQTEDDFFPTGFDSHDKALGRFRRGQVIFVGARPSMGKTAWLLSSAVNQLENGIHVYFFSLEMPEADMIARMVSIKSGISLFNIIQRRVSDEEVKRMVGVLPAIQQLPGDWASDVILHRIEKLFDQIKPNSRSIVYIDFLGMIEVPELGGAESYAATTQIGLALKRAALRLSIPIIAAVQLNRKVEERKDKQPTLADFRDSGRLEEIGDVCFGLYRPGFYDQKLPDNELQVFCLKNRNGPRVNYVLAWDKECARAREKTKLSWTEVA